MTKVCSRPTCNVVARARFSFDSLNRLIILDRKLDEWGGSGNLCENHADRLVVPRGWALDDRRVAEPTLFPTTKFETGGRLSPLARTARRLVNPEAHPSTPLPLDGGDTYSLPDGYVDRFDEAMTAPLPGFDSAPKRSGRHYDDGSGPGDDADTPLLNKAFDNEESRLRPHSLEKLIPTSPGPNPDAHPASTTRSSKAAVDSGAPNSGPANSGPANSAPANSGPANSAGPKPKTKSPKPRPGTSKLAEPSTPPTPPSD